jgi:hypothetical protein
VHHDDPLKVSADHGGYGNYYDYGYDENGNPLPPPSYDATVSSSLLATGQSGKKDTGGRDDNLTGDDVWAMQPGRENTGQTGKDVILDHSGQDVTVQLDVDTPPTRPDADHSDIGSSRVSGAYAMDGGRVEVTGKNVSVSASAGGQARGESGTAVITGVRADGAVYDDTPPPVRENFESDADYYEASDNYYRDHGGTGTKITDKSNVTLNGEEVDVRADITGNSAARDYSNSVYAAVAATDNGQVDINSAGDVNISVSNRAEGDISVGGAHGIYAGQDIAPGDSHSTQDDPYPYHWYENQMTNEYMSNKYGADRVTGANRHQQSEVNVRADGDVNVNVDLGSAARDGDASGVTASWGDVNVKAGGDINVNVASHGEHRDGNLSAITAKDGTVIMQAEGDINLRLTGNGEHLSVIETSSHVTGPNEYIKYNEASRLEGENITLTGRAGQDGTARDNSIAGIASSAGKGGGFILQADERVTIDVAARDNGGHTEVTGILARNDSDAPDSYHYGKLNIRAEGDEMVIKAAVENSPQAGGDSKAAGISVENTTFGLAGKYTERGEHYLKDYGGRESGRHMDTAIQYDGYTRGVESLKIDVSGARHNAGIELLATDKTGSSYPEAMMTLRADSLDIDVQGGHMNGDTASYGINVENSKRDGGVATAFIHTDDLNITVRDDNRAVGLRADGGERGAASLNISNSMDYHGIYDEHGNYQGLEAKTHAFNMVITCTVGDDPASQVKGIAIEAVNNGCVHIFTSGGSSSPEEDGQRISDSITINGHIVADGAHDRYRSLVNIGFDQADTDGRFTMDGDIRSDHGALVEINMGDGDDRFEMKGDIRAENGADVYIDTGAGDDVIRLNGAIVRESGGTVHITGGEGYDILVLSAPDADTFMAWYGAWLRDVDLDRLSCEKIVMNGFDPANSQWLTEMLNDYASHNPEFSYKYKHNGHTYVFGNGELTGTDGNDIITALDGDSALLGGRGDDVLYGGHGNDFLDGGQGHNQVYGGGGNDIMVWHAGDTFDGGDGLDALLVNMNESAGKTLDQLFGSAANTEVIIQVNGDHSRDSLADMGVSMGDDGLRLSGGNWNAGTSADGHYTTYTNNDNGTVVTVNTSQTEIDTAAQEIIIKAITT